MPTEAGVNHTLRTWGLGTPGPVLPRKRPIPGTRGPDMSGPYCAFLNKIKTKGELHG